MFPLSHLGLAVVGRCPHRGVVGRRVGFLHLEKQQVRRVANMRTKEQTCSTITADSVILKSACTSPSCEGRSAMPPPAQPRGTHRVRCGQNVGQVRLVNCAHVLASFGCWVVGRTIEHVVPPARDTSSPHSSFACSQKVSSARKLSERENDLGFSSDKRTDQAAL